jgi:4-alpha-glucanotransferase
MLVRDGLVKKADLTPPGFPAGRVDYGPVIDFKRRLLAHVWERFQAGAASGLRSDFDEFRAAEKAWLDDFALFMALKNAHGDRSWLTWPPELAQRQRNALLKATAGLGGSVPMHMFGQFLFFRQWKALKQYASGKGIRMIGDVPIFVSSDSADVWANPGLFLLDKERRPKVVSGVPPDYFSKTGQLWGNPLYNWKTLKKSGYAWWVSRLRATLEQVDLVRLDHFRGFEAYWEVPAGKPTAQEGRWVKGPGAAPFEAMRKELGRLPLIAEDLGVITPEVEALRRQLVLPGMRILQFAFGGAFEERFLPHAYEHNTVVYTGTHDNDTTCGWYACLTEKERRFLGRYLPGVGRDISWEMIGVAWASVADYALAPLQDVLSLGTEARMNHPGRPSGNWRWRFTEGMLTPALLDRLADLTEIYRR